MADIHILVADDCSGQRLDAFLGANMDRDLGEVVKEIRASYAASRPEGGSAQ